MKKLLDLYSGAGGAGYGYKSAGFYVTGVDIKPQTRYAGDEFVQADAIEYVKAHGHLYDAIHASPPCQAYSRLTPDNSIHPDLLGETRAALIQANRVWVIENVEGAPMTMPITLCGEMFGLKVIRHRLFESGMVLFAPEHKKHRTEGTNGAQRPGIGCVPGEGYYFAVYGKRSWDKGTLAQWRDAMGIDWMDEQELTQAIPPAYTEYIGRFLMRAISEKTA